MQASLVVGIPQASACGAAGPLKTNVIKLLRMQHNYRRIVIFGNGAAGKTTLAKRLGKEMQSDVLELDHVRWDEAREKLNTPEKCKEVILKFIKSRENWIIEGLHSSLLEVAINHATEIHFLNPGFDVCRARAVSRPWDPRKSSSPESQQKLFEKYEPWFKSYDTRTDEASLSAHRTLFDRFSGLKFEHTDAKIEL